MKKIQKIQIQRESFGVNGIDDMIEGGLPKEGVFGLSGPPGIGKSILALHFLLEGARKGQKCLYINLEEPRGNIDNMLGQFDFGKEFLDYEKKELIVIRCYNYLEYEKIQKELLQKIKDDKKIKRLVIDSFNCFFSSIGNACSVGQEINVRKLITDSFYQLRKDDLTILLVLEKKNDSYSFEFNIPYLIDGLIQLDFLDLGVIERRIFIPKMRWTNQYKESKNYEISSKGIEVIHEE